MQSEFKPILEMLFRHGLDREEFIERSMRTPGAQQMLISNVPQAKGEVLDTMLAALWRLMRSDSFVDYYARPKVCRSEPILQFVWRQLSEHQDEFTDAALWVLQPRQDILGELAGSLLRHRLEAPSVCP
jgi:hypothetical protein